MKRLLFVLGAVAVLTSVPAAVQAQTSKAVRIYPRAGVIAPDWYFYEHFANFVGDGLTEWTRSSLGRAFVAGVGVEARLGKGDVLIRGEVMRSFDSWLSAGHHQETLRDLFIPPEVVSTFLDVPMNMTLTSVQVVLPTRFTVGPFQPYVLVGGGGKYYQFGEPTTANDVGATLPDNGFTWGGDLGAGFMVRLAGLHLDFQARDAWNKYWGKTQHDMLYTGTVSLGLF